MSHCLSEQDCAEFYRQQIFACNDLNLLELLLGNLRQLKSDPALAVMIDWLATDNGRKLESSSNFAASIIDEENAQGLFAQWWQLRGELSPLQKNIAAAALCPRNQQARNHLYSIFHQLDPGPQSAFLDRLDKNAQDSDFAIWTDWFLDDSLKIGLRQKAAKTLVNNLPNSSNYCLDLLDQFAVDAKNTSRDRIWLRFITLLLASDEHEVRELGIKTIDAVEDLLGVDALQLRKARQLSYKIKPEYLSSNRLIDELLNEFSRPEDLLVAVTSLGQIKNKYQDLQDLISLTNGLAEIDQHLFKAISNSPVANLQRDKVFILATNQELIPETSSWAQLFLNTVETNDSWRRTLLMDAPHQLEPKFWIDSARLFNFLSTNLGTAKPPAGIEGILSMARTRWSQDHRSFNYSGWFLLHSPTPDNLAAANNFFAAAEQRLGSNLDSNREPRLGRTIVANLLSGENQLQQLFLRDPDSEVLLNARLPRGLIEVIDRIR